MIAAEIVIISSELNWAEEREMLSFFIIHSIYCPILLLR